MRYTGAANAFRLLENFFRALNRVIAKRLCRLHMRQARGTLYGIHELGKPPAAACARTYHGYAQMFGEPCNIDLNLFLLCFIHQVHAKDCAFCNGPRLQCKVQITFETSRIAHDDSYIRFAA